ncbi:MAG: nucleoside-diphosphate kinase [Bacteroidales bacterium]|nr:nucleoside-diphosphate kinase [Bacteroidales bacterium]
MNGNETFTIIKPCAVKAGHIGNILADILKSGFRLVSMKFTRMSRNEAETFYAIHQEQPFFGELVDFMISGPIVVAILSKENAVADFRTLIGTTNPANAAEGTIRKKYGQSVQNNAIHGSDSDENAALEASYFFPAFERYVNY